MAQNIARKVKVKVPPKVAEAKPQTSQNRQVRDDTRRLDVRDVQAIVPDKTFADSYVSRVIAGQTDLDILRYARKAHRNVLIEGPTGPGKTSFVLAYAATDRLPFYSIPCNIGVEPSQMFGKYLPDGEGSFKWFDGPVTTMVRNGGVLLINEINMMPAKVGAVLFSLLDKRRQITLGDHKGEVITAHPDFQVVADMNPGYEGTRDLNAALRNRFPIKLDWDYAPTVEKQLVACGPLLDMAQKLRAQMQSGNIETPVSTNMLQEFEAIAKDLSVQFAVQNFISAFTGDERESVKVVVQTFRAGIDRHFNPPKAEAKDSKVNEDEDWGIEGVDWVYDDIEN